jgi:hypothetical protein
MTTHDQRTEFDNTAHEADVATVGTQPVTEHTAPTMAESTQNQTAPQDGGMQNSAAQTTAGAVPPEQAGAERAGSAQRETSMDTSLFADDQLEGLRARWNSVQAGFVDDPRECVQKADGLVSDLVDQLTAGFADARSRLEEQWSRGEEASTEDLRVALKHYREFFERLLVV